MTDKKTPQPGLKRVSQGESWEAGPTVLYLEDVEEIYGLFRRVSDDVTLRLDGYELDSPASATQLKSTVTRDLRISSSSPSASFAGSVVGFRFFSSDRENLALLGLKDATKAVLVKRRLRPKSLRPFWVLLGFSWLGGLAPYPLQIPGIILAVTGPVLFGSANLIDLYNQVRRDGKVILRNSHVKPSFRQANRDLLLVLLTISGTLLTTVMGGIIVYLVLRFVGKA